MPSNISIQRIIGVLLSRLKLIVVATLLGGVLFYCYSYFMITPMYSTSAMFAIQNYSVGTSGSNDNAKKIFGSDLSGSATLASVSMILFQNSDELSAVYSGCGVSLSVEDFFVTVNVTGTDAQLVANVANQVCEKCEDVFKSYYSYGSIRTIRAAKVPGGPFAPDNKHYGTMGLGVGLGISCLISILLELIDTTIKAEDDIQQMYGVPVFAEIPDFENQG